MARETITVGCSMPMGIVLRIFDWIEVIEPSRNDSERTVKKSIECGRIKLNGSWSNVQPEQRRGAKSIAPGYGLTHNVDKELYMRWREQNAESDLVKNLVVFAHTETASVQARSREMEKEISHKGSAPLDPTMTSRQGNIVPKDPRFPRPIPVEGGDRIYVTAADR